MLPARRLLRPQTSFTQGPTPRGVALISDLMAFNALQRPSTTIAGSRSIPGAST
jgi:hypothetical protein